MKKFIYSLYSLVFILAICCVGLTSCGGDDDDLGISDTGEQGQGSGNSHLGTGEYEFVEVFFKKNGNITDVKAYMKKNYSNYDISAEGGQGNAIVLGYIGNRNTTAVLYTFWGDKLVRSSVTYGEYTEENFKKLQSDVSRKYNVVLEKKTDQDFSGVRFIQYSGKGTIDEGDGVLKDVVIELYGNIGPDVSSMTYNVGLD